MLAQRMTILRCNGNEWDSQGDCERLAHACLDSCQDIQIVQVYEHGGWHRTFVRDGAGMVCIDSANDTAVYRGRAAELRQLFGSCAWNYHHVNSNKLR